TDQRVGLCQRLEMRVKAESAVQCLGKTLPACPTWPQLACRCGVIDGGMPGNGAFDQRQFTAAETRAFTGRVVIGPARGLPGIDRERRAIECAAQRLTELSIGNQAETTGQVIT